MNKTTIEYMDFSWNPLAMRCTPVSAGCANCWHLAMADRLAGNDAFTDEVRAAYIGEGPPVLVEERLAAPLRRKKAAIIGVQFMGDLYHEAVSDEFIRQVFWVIRRCPQHTFLILTKRPLRMLIHHEHEEFRLAPESFADVYSNVWFGLTVENQETADKRRADFEAVPAAVKFVSYEPALGPIDWTGWEFVSQIISGGESGPKARPSHPDWHRATRDFCQGNGIAYFFKQWGEWAPYINHDVRVSQFHWFKPDDGSFSGDPDMHRIGKKAAGHLLDGQEWREFPA